MYDAKYMSQCMLILLVVGCVPALKETNIRSQLSIYTGTTLVTSTTVPDSTDQCPRCDGRGKYPIADTGKWMDPCDVCEGKGMVDVPTQEEMDHASRSVDQDQDQDHASRSVDQDQDHASRSVDYPKAAVTVKPKAIPFYKVDELESINWIPLTVARQNNKPTWVHFVSQDCPPCVALERGPFNDPQIIKTSRGFNCVQIQVPSDNSIIWGVRSTPTDVWVTSDWKIIGRVNPPDSDFLRYFKDWERKLWLK